MQNINNREDYLNTIIQTSIDGFWVVDSNKRFIDVNESYLKMSGYSRSEFLKLYINDIDAEEKPEQTSARINNIKANGGDLFETSHRKKNGDIFDVEVSVKYIDIDGGRFICFCRDISKRKKWEKELLISYLIFNHSIDMLCIAGFDGYFKNLNPAWKNTLGWTNEELLSKPWIEFVHKDDRNSTEKVKKVIVEGNEIYKFENRYISKDGSIKWLSWNTFPFEHEQIMVGVARDITEQKRMEDELRKSEEKYKLLFENMTQGFALHEIILDKNNKPIDYRFVDVNPAFEELTGVKRNSVIGKRVKEILPNTEQYWIDTFGKVALTGKPVRYKNYSEAIGKHFETWAFSPVKGQFAVMFSDISDMQNAIEALKESEEKFRLLFESNNDGLAMFLLNEADPSNIIECNSHMAKMLGYSKEEMLNLNPISIEHPTPSEEHIKARITEMKINGHTLMETKVRHNDGYLIEIEIKAIMIDYNGKVAILNIARDITKKKLYQQELIIAKEKAEASDKLKSAFLANMSHEIRTPMNGIIGFADLLKDPELTGENKLKYISIIETSGKRMLNLINDLIDISKIESKQMEINIREININEQLEFLYEFFKHEAENKDIDLSMKPALPHNKANIFTDQEKFVAIMINLIKNALKFTHSGSIVFGYNEKNGVIEFFVKDTGVGIPISKQEIIFERFAQADLSNSRNYEGAGLGLSISKAYVEMLGGRIWLESHKNTGSTFYFNLDIKGKSNQINQVEIDYDIEDNVYDKCILIAEDDEISKQYLEQILEGNYSKLLFARTGIEAVDLCKSNLDINLILMDIKMPDMDGLTATRKIRKFNKDVIIIAQTAFALSGDKEKALNAGCNDYLTKPIKANKLFEIINKYL